MALCCVFLSKRAAYAHVHIHTKRVSSSSPQLTYIRTYIHTYIQGLEFFACGDQLLRGAALNAVLIAEALMEPVGKPFVPKL